MLVVALPPLISVLDLPSLIELKDNNLFQSNKQVIRVEQQVNEPRKFRIL